MWEVVVSYLEIINLILLGLNLMFFISVNYFFRCVYKYFITIKQKDENVEKMFKMVNEQYQLVDEQYREMTKIVIYEREKKDA